MKKSAIAYHILRYGFTALFIWFGLSQLISPDRWTSFIPEWVTALSGLSAHSFVLLNGGAEIFLAFCLAFDVMVHLVAPLLFLHMMGIALDIGVTPVGVRDFGLAISLLAFSVLSRDSEFVE